MQQFAKVPILQSFRLKLLNSSFEDQVRVLASAKGTILFQTQSGEVQATECFVTIERVILQTRESFTKSKAQL